MESVLVLRGFPNLVIRAPREFFGGFLGHLHDHFIPHHRNNYHPHVFSHRLTSLWAVLLVSVKIFTLSYISLGPAVPAFSSAITPTNIIALTNESRKSFGLEILKENSVLNQAAQTKANDMAAKSYFAHTSPDGKLPWDFIQAAGYTYIIAGENLAVNFIEAESVSDAWMNSPTHKANILNKNFEEIGIGIAEGTYSGKSSMFVVQMFGVPAEEKIVLKDQPTQVATASVPLPEPKVSEPPQILAAKPAVSQVAPIPSLDMPASSVEIKDVALEVQDEKLLVKVKASPEAVKVLAVYGQKAGMLLPKAGDWWEASLPIKNLSEGEQKLTVKAFDINNQTAQKAVATFADSPAANYNFLAEGQVAGKNVEVFGKAIDLGGFEQRFYLLFVAAVLTCLILAIAIRRHVQHLAVVANGSFVAILAALLWMG